MNRPSIVVLVLVALAAVAGYLLFGSRGSPGPDAPVAVGAPAADAPKAADLASAGPGAEADPGADAARRAVSRAAHAELDPDIRAALSGFKGRVVDSEGAPSPETVVRLFRFAADSVMTPGVGVFVDKLTSEPDIDAGEAETDDDGRFLITGVWPRAFYLLEAGVGGDSHTYEIVQRTPNPGEVVDLGDIRLETLGVLTGVVVDQDGEPVAGALVRAVDLPGAALAMVPVERFDPTGGLIVVGDEAEVEVVLVCPPWVERRFEQLPIASTRSDSDGRFRLGGVVPGGNVVAVTAKGMLSNVRPRVVVKAGEEKDLGKTRLREGEICYGRVVDEEDEPIVGAQVLIAPETKIAPVHFASFAEPTGKDGTFELGGIPAGNVIVAARREPGDPWVLAPAQPVAKDVVVRLASSFSLAVAVRSEAGLEIEAPRFQLVPGQRGRGGLEMAMWGAVQPLDLDGRLETLEDGRTAIHDLPRGKYVLTVAASGHAAASSDVVVEHDVEVAIDLPANKAFQVRVVNSAGKPVRRAAIYAEGTGDARDMPDMPLHAGYTRRDGTLVVETVNADRVRLSALHPAYGAAHAESELPPPAPIVLVLEDPGTIEGTLLENGQTPTPGKWFVYASRRWDGQRGAMPDMPRMTLADLDGRFVLRGLRPGNYEVGVQQSLAALNSPGRVMNFAMQAFMMTDRDEERVVVVGNQTTQVVLDALRASEVTGPSANISGSVLLDGRPAVGYVVMGRAGRRRFSAEIDAAGRFDLGRVEVGNAYLTVMKMPSGDLFSGPGDMNEIWQQSFEVKDGEDQDLSIEIETSGLSGFVMLPGGAPAAQAHVSISGQVTHGDTTSNTSRRAQADDQGRFRFDRIPAGSYSIDASLRGKARGKLEGIEVAPGLPMTGVRVEMHSVVNVSGTLDLSAAGIERPDWMWVRFEELGEDGQPSGESHYVQVRDDNRFETSDLEAGTYRAVLHSGGENVPRLPKGHQLIHDAPIVVGARDIEGLVIRPVSRPVK